MRLELPWSRIRFLERKNRVLEENYHLLSELYGENERLYHDMNHHLQMLYYLAQKQNAPEIMEYVTSISAPINQLSDVIWSGVDVVDAILNHAVSEARASQITMDVNVEFPRICSISSDDLCIILFNLLDNAMEACRTVHKKAPQAVPVISVTIRLIHQFLMIKVENPYVHRPRRISDFFLSTKPDDSHHGIGLRNVRETAEKYGGNLEFEVKDGTFVTSVLLFPEII